MGKVFVILELFFHNLSIWFTLSREVFFLLPIAKLEITCWHVANKAIAKLNLHYFDYFFLKQQVLSIILWLLVDTTFLEWLGQLLHELDIDLYGIQRNPSHSPFAFTPESIFFTIVTKKNA